MPAPHNDELTAKERAFCEAYVECYDIILQTLILQEVMEAKC